MWSYWFFSRRLHFSYPNEDPSAKVKAIAIVPIRRTDLYIACSHWILKFFQQSGFYLGLIEDNFMIIALRQLQVYLSLVFDFWWRCKVAALFVEVTEKCKCLKVCHDCSQNYTNVICMNYNYVQFTILFFCMKYLSIILLLLVKNQSFLEQ